MNSFKRTAIVIAAALTSTALVIAPASAAPLAVTVAGSANTTTALAPAAASVPADNKVDSADAVALVATADTGTVVTFASTGGVRLVLALDNAPTAPVLASAGTTTHSATSQGVGITVYAFTTSTATGSVTITNGAYSTIVYVKGNAGSAYNIGLSVPSAVAVGTIPSVAVNVTDVFGNAVGGETVTATLIGATWADASISKSIVTSTAANVAGDSTLTLGSKSEKLALAVAGNVTVAATGAISATAVTGLPAPVKAAVATFSVTDLNGVIAGLNGQIASLNAQLSSINAQLVAEKAARAADKVAADKALADAKAASDSATVTAKVASDLALAKAAAAYKAEYNALAKKWNAKNPKARVALKK
jgi:hypothetical protein